MKPSRLRVPSADAITLRVLAMAAAVYAILGLTAQAVLPEPEGLLPTPIRLFLLVAIAIAVAVTVMEAIRHARRGGLYGYWLLAVGAISAIALLQVEDVAVDRLGPDAATGLEYIGNAALAIIVAAGLISLSRLPRQYRWLGRALGFTIVFQILALLGEFFEVRSLFDWAIDAREVVFTAELAQLLCIEFFVVAIVMSGQRIAAKADREALPAVLAGLPVAAVGARMREVFRHGGLRWRASHPPVKIAFYPGIRELAVVVVASWLVAKAGPGVKAATGKPMWRQAREMVGLWFSDGIDPPSYYALELYRAANRKMVPEFLTRFETKNGLLGILNGMRRSPYAVSEMSHKEVFYEACRQFNLPHPRVLASVENGHISLHVHRDLLKTDLFCKQQRGMGAIGTVALRFEAPDRFVEDGTHSYTLDEALAHLVQVSAGERMLVQPWLRNHPEIADFAQDSLITFRVVTCLDERNHPEVVLAMLRVLAKLEHRWSGALDEEYAAPIDLASGRLGLFTGDNMTTSPLRYERHPITGCQVKDRLVRQWPEIRDLGLAAHRAFPHRTLIGWDIALTPDGPSLLEGNSNLDVMFLQRVHDLPAGETRFGVLLSHHLDHLVAQVVKPHQAIG